VIGPSGGPVIGPSGGPVPGPFSGAVPGNPEIPATAKELRLAGLFS